MTINLSGLSEPYVISENANEKLNKTLKSNTRIYKLGIVLAIISTIFVLIKAFSDSNIPIITTLIIALNLMLVVSVLTINEKIKSVFKEDLKAQNRINDARLVRAKYSHNDIATMCSCLLQVVLQII